VTINFILDGIGTSGGIRMVFNLANYLAGQGHTVGIYNPVKKTSKVGIYHSRRLTEIAKTLKHFIFIDRFGLRKIPFPHNFPIHFVKSLKPKNINNADIIIATACKTAFEIARYPKSKGKKFFFIQDFEDWCNPPNTALASWRLPLKAIVTCKHLAHMYKQNTGKKPFAIVPCGIEEKFFRYKAKKNQAKFLLRAKETSEDGSCQPRRLTKTVILMIYNSAWRKGGDDGIKTLKIVKQKFPNIKIILFGIDKKIKQFKSWAKIYYFPSQKRIIKLYHNAGIFVFPSRREGFGLPGLEALAGQCALVTTDVGAVREYSKHNHSSLISPPKNPQKLAQNIIYLLKNLEEIERLSENGFKKALEYKLKKMGKNFEKTLY